MLSSFRTHSMVFRTILVCLSFVFVLFFAGGIVIGIQLYVSSREENSVYLNNLIQNICSSADSIIYNASQVNRMLLNHVATQDILYRCQQPSYTVQDYQTDLATLSYTMTTLSVGENSFFASFFDKNGNVLFPNNTFARPDSTNLFDDPWVKEHRSEIDHRYTVLVSPNQISQEAFRGYRFFMVVRPLTDLNQEVLAYIAVYADCEDFDAVLSKNLEAIRKKNGSSPVRAIRLLDSDGFIISSTNPEEVGLAYESLGISEEPLSMQVPNSPFIVKLEPNASFFLDSLKMPLFILALLLLFLLFLFSIFIIVTMDALFYPIKCLTKAMACVSEGNFEIQLDETPCKDNDIKQLFCGFNYMISQINALIKNVYNQKIQLKSAQLQSLKYQINPHFLYNTLQTLEAIGEIQNFPEIQIISSSLAQMFRYNLKEENIVPLKAELAHLETYFSIERIRFRDQIRFRIDIGQELYDILVPKFILQPIVENAIIHGFHAKGGINSILISAYQEGSKLLLKVSDNGQGIEPSRLQHLQQLLENSKSASAEITAQESIGLLNVQHRIINICGRDSGISVKSQQGNGTEVILSLPINLNN